MRNNPINLDSGENMEIEFEDSTNIGILIATLIQSCTHMNNIDVIEQLPDRSICQGQS